MLTLKNMKTLYFDCFSGISGDMTIGALLDLGLDFDYLKAELKKLPVEGYELRASRVVRANVSAMKFDVLMEGDHNHPQAHEHPHEHHIPPEDVEFHEVGAVDSIVDTAGSAIGFDALGIERFLCSAINIGRGFIHCQHGIFPVPAPATADLLRQATIYSKYANTELVTPTGAAILAAVVDRFEPLQSFATDRIGYSAGTKQFTYFPNCLRLMVGEERELASASGGETVTIIEANIDDMTPQNFGYVTEKLLAAGALDAFTVPVQMKKGRPGHLLQVLARPDSAEVLSRIIFQETTTIGIRRHSVNRTTLDREFVEVETAHGRVRIKVSRLDGEIVNFAPEYEDCARIAREKGVALKRVQADALRAYLNRQGLHS